MRSCGSTSSVGSVSTSPVPSGGCSQAVTSASPVGGSGAVVGIGHPPAHDGDRRAVRTADGERRDDPVAVVTLVLASGDVDRAVGDPGAGHRHRLPDPVAREGVVRSHHVLERHRLGVGQVGRLGVPVRLPGGELPVAEPDGGGDEDQGQQVSTPVPRGEHPGHPVSVRSSHLGRPLDHVDQVLRARRRRAHPGDAERAPIGGFLVAVRVGDRARVRRARAGSGVRR